MGGLVAPQDGLVSEGEPPQEQAGQHTQPSACCNQAEPPKPPQKTQNPPKKPQTSQNLPKPPRTPQNPKNAVTAGSRKTEVLSKRSVLSHPDASRYQGYIQQVTLYGHMTPSNISSCIMITYQGRLVFYFPRLANNKLTECGNTRSRRSAALQHSNWSCAVHSHSMLVSSKHYCLYWC